MKLKIGNIISIISVLILLKGLNSYFNVKNKKWTKIDAFVANIDVLSRTVNKDKKYRLITKYNYQVDDVNYNGIYMLVTYYVVFPAIYKCYLLLLLLLPGYYHHHYYY